MDGSQNMLKNRFIIIIRYLNIFDLQIRIKKHAAMQEATLKRVKSVQRKLEIDF